MLRLMMNNEKIPVSWMKFSDGAITCKIEGTVPEWPRSITITVDPSTDCSIVLEELRMLVSAIRNTIKQPADVFNLNLPYLPYARADRIFEIGNPNPLQVFLSEVEQFRFNMLYLTDPHNLEAVRKYYHRSFSLIQQHELADELLYGYLSPCPSYDYVIAPDKGAVDKAKRFCEKIDKPLLTATKVRDVSTGRIIDTHFDVDVDLRDKSVLIIDDILDGGGTFIPLAEKLKEYGAATVDLYVTHLIAAKGLDIFKGNIDNIYCFQTVGNFVNQTDVLNFNKG